MSGPTAITPIPVTIDGVQAALVGRLQARLGPDWPGVPVTPYDDDPAGYRLAGRAAVLVAYSGDDFGPPAATDGMVQDRTIEFGAAVLARSYRGDGGATALVEAVLRALVGFVPAGCGAVSAVKADLVGQAEGRWTYLVTVAVPTVLVGDAAPEAGAPLALVQTTDTDFGASEVPQEAA